jgi:hypothetical protein
MLKFIKRNPLSILASVILIYLLCWQCYRIGSWKNQKAIIHDITSYYSYLPAVFIYSDLNFDFRYTLPENEPKDHLWVNVRGDTVFQKMSVGLAYFYAPTFLIADAYARRHSEYNRNGFSKPYQMALALNTLFIGLLGLFCMLLLLRKFFSDRISAITLLLIYAGTNLLYYISVAPGLSHAYSLFLLTLLTLICLQLYKNPKTTSFILIAIISGWIVLIRPTNIFLCLIPLLLLFSSASYDTLRKFIYHRAWLIPVFAFCFLIPWIPQILYWKHSVGSYFFYSYDQEGFFFQKSHFWDGLFGYRKGWFIYTPIMFIALLGLFIRSELNHLTRTTLLILLPFVFVVFSWWCWWYGGSFGSRVMVETYPFMALGLALFLRKISSGFWLLRIPIAGVLAFLVILNLNQIYQYSIGMMHWDSMTKEAYWGIFNKDLPPSNFQDLLEHPDYEKAKIKGEDL